MANETNKAYANCGICAMTQKERYEYFRKEINSVKSALINANTTDTVETAISALATLMDHSSKDWQLKNMYNWISDINGSINAVRLYDNTRKELEAMLDKMLESIEALISEEQAKEGTEKLRKFFLACAENAESIAKIVDIAKIII